MEKDLQMKEEYESTDWDESEEYAHKIPNQTNEAKNRHDEVGILENILQLTTLIVQWDRDAITKQDI